MKISSYNSPFKKAVLISMWCSNRLNWFTKATKTPELEILVTGAKASSYKYFWVAPFTTRLAFYF